MEDPTPLEEALAELGRELKTLDESSRRGSRYVGTGADAAVSKHIADGGSVERGTGTPIDYGHELAESGFKRRIAPHRGERGGSLSKMLLDIARKDTAHLTPAAEHKALAEQTDGSGGFLLVPQLYDQVMQLVRAIPGVMKLNPTRLTGESKRIDLPGLTNPSATAAWTAENAQLPVTTEQFSIVNSLVPHVLGTLLVTSVRLLEDANANPSIEQVIRQDLANVMGVGLDNALVNGTGTGQPRGLLNVSGTTAPPNTNIGVNGGQVSFPLLADIQSALRSANIVPQRPGWLLAPRDLGNIIRLTTSTGQPLMESPSLLSINPDGVSGRLLGAPFAVSGNMPTNQTRGTSSTASSIVYGDFAELFYAEWDALSLDSSSEASYTPDGGTTWISSFQAQQVVFRSTLWCDAQVRRAASFVIQPGITG
jgi:HK97 family phage major capsid protein